MRTTLNPHESEALRALVDKRGALSVAVSVGCALPTLRAALNGSRVAGVTRTAILSALAPPEARAA
jgi:hypothetical protein